MAIGQIKITINKYIINKILKKRDNTHKKAHGYRNNWKPSNLIKKKLFAFTDSTVVEA